jgi:hypothetical protein
MARGCLGIPSWTRRRATHVWPQVGSPPSRVRSRSLAARTSGREREIVHLTEQRDSGDNSGRQAGARFDVTPEALSALPSLVELGVPQEMLEGAAQIADASDVPGLEEFRLELIVRYLVYHARSFLGSN